MCIDVGISVGRAQETEKGAHEREESGFKGLGCGS